MTDQSNELSCHVEFFFGGIVRIFDEGLWYGDPYRIACPFKFVAPGEVELIGLNVKPKPSEWKAAVRVMRGYGLTAIMQRKSGANPGRREMRGGRSGEAMVD